MDPWTWTTAGMTVSENAMAASVPRARHARARAAENYRKFAQNLLHSANGFECETAPPEYPGTK
eukprot:361579-Chlamydomonas_euryale.AAC.6